MALFESLISCNNPSAIMLELEVVAEMPASKYELFRDSRRAIQIPISNMYIIHSQNPKIKITKIY